MKYDWEHIRNLFEVAEKALGHPKLKVLGDAAAAELEAIANPSEPEQKVEVRKSHVVERDYDKR